MKGTIPRLHSHTSVFIESDEEICLLGGKGIPPPLNTPRIYVPSVTSFASSLPLSPSLPPPPSLSNFFKDEKDRMHSGTKLRLTLNTPRIYDVLPVSTLRDILRLLPPVALCRLSQVNHKFLEIANESIL